ncbi:hypothetical protein DUNSADRAFT_15706 [Dunaliella salina]|uniref:Uncharacterized protein n=1 Tax=Dunaliella salina TaxID=3046 RepID=A0ABQ7G4V7_DUNSA|nr:hypothetical protein DUNSADRAFT_15706 [Dunaliella salina]|eukprot:KAF5829639.1 hypothetical protein DUNSADRAFT_15706 [Dunaliella salina]
MDLLWEGPTASGEKELPTSTKSDEELAKYTVDEHLSETERTVLFLNGGLGVQQRHAIANLPHIIKGRGRSAWESLAGPLKTALNRLDADAQVEAAEVFVQITRERLMSPADLQACLLPTVVRHINKEKSEEETEAWVSALCELIPVLDKETLKSQVMSMALSKGDMEDNASSRVICARILGACAPYLTKEEIERSFFKKAMAMCQDVDYNVRLSMCEQLPHIGRACGKDSALSNLLVELFELLKDEELKVGKRGRSHEHNVHALRSLTWKMQTCTPVTWKKQTMHTKYAWRFLTWKEQIMRSHACFAVSNVERATCAN